MQTEHHHLVCTGCGAVRAVVLDDATVEVPPAPAAGFRLGRPEVTFRGLCPACLPPPGDDASELRTRG